MIKRRSERKSGSSREMKIYFQFRDEEAVFPSKEGLYFSDRREVK